MSDRPALSDKAVLVPDHVLVREVAGELVILSLESEEYYGLDPVGARIWQLVSSEPTVGAAFQTLLGEYDVDAATLARDLDKLLHELSTRNLIGLVEPGAS